MPYSWARHAFLFYIVTDLQDDNIYKVHWSKEKRLLIDNQRGQATSALPSTPRHPKGSEESNLNRMKAFPNFQHDDVQVTLARLVLFWSRDSQIWLHIRIYRGALKNMAMPRLYPKSIRLEYPAVRSHQCF